jgi:hypothetical protein
MSNRLHVAISQPKTTADTLTEAFGREGRAVTRVQLVSW